MKRMGRPSKLTEATTARIVQAIKMGAYVETASSFAGIARETYQDWMRKGRRDSETGKRTKEATFLRKVEGAMSEAELIDLQTIAKFAQGITVKTERSESTTLPDGSIQTKHSTETKIVRSWQAAAWRLERRWPAKWGRRMELSGPGGEAIGQNVVVYLPDNKRAKPIKPKGNGNGRGIRGSRIKSQRSAS